MSSSTTFNLNFNRQSFKPNHHSREISPHSTLNFNHHPHSNFIMMTNPCPNPISLQSHLSLYQFPHQSFDNNHNNPNHHLHNPIPHRHLIWGPFPSSPSPSPPPPPPPPPNQHHQHILHRPINLENTLQQNHSLSSFTPRKRQRDDTRHQQQQHQLGLTILNQPSQLEHADVSSDFNPHRSNKRPRRSSQSTTHPSNPPFSPTSTLNLWDQVSSLLDHLTHPPPPYSVESPTCILPLSPPPLSSSNLNFCPSSSPCLSHSQPQQPYQTFSWYRPSASTIFNSYQPHPEFWHQQNI